MRKQVIINHLELALAGDPDLLREKVERLHRALTKRPKRPNVATKRTRFIQRDHSTWEVWLSREDAKTVEEIWQDFMSRKRLEGSWKTFSKNGKPVPKKFSNRTYIFTFVREPEVVHAIKMKQPPAKPTLASTLNQVNKLSKEERIALLKQLSQ